MRCRCCHSRAEWRVRQSVAQGRNEGLMCGARKVVPREAKLSRDRCGVALREACGTTQEHKRSPYLDGTPGVRDGLCG
ncbi:hypothetical protein NDU88_006671 [Pleurodeles waltl]|uniref:Uncharacterized protein n=1 Tax=Pleurodeles waltl TaxID=8319 RepID=A0AAV7RSJ0_PLEWA|nr:hypothetical protein NDU88_006671 [Pleurodeles waltl]